MAGSEEIEAGGRPEQRSGRVDAEFEPLVGHDCPVWIDTYHRTLYGADQDLDDDVGDAAVLGLLRHDGYAMSVFDASFESLQGRGGVLFVHGIRPTRDGQPLAASEIEHLLRFVDEGGSLFLVAGHDPNEQALGYLLSSLGVIYRGGFVHHPDHPSPQGGPCSWFTMTPGKGIEDRHPILKTAGASGLPIRRVGYYCGGAMLCHHRSAVLRMPRGTQLLSQVGNSRFSESSDAYVGMCAQPFGKGRIAIALDRGIFRCEEIERGDEMFYITMSQPDLDNASLFVATMRWLRG